ncbi:unnamed protein product [Acidocella sp. C78]|nr:unnamed protein product [Acidocella sp. C78]
MSSPLISTEALAAILDDPALILFDASFYLPNETQNAAALFEAAHLPGAAFFDIERIADTASPLPHMLPDEAGFAAAVEALGVGNDSRIVVYDQRGLFSAARGWWMFRVFGHENVAVLDGGLPKWRQEGRRLDSGPRARAHAGASPPASMPPASATGPRSRPISPCGTKPCSMPAPPAATPPRCPSRAPACAAAMCPAPARCPIPNCWATTLPCLRPKRCAPASPPPASMDQPGR